MVLFVLSAILGYGVLWTISFLVQMTAFWLINIWSLITIKDVLVNVLSGKMIPLWFMPIWMTGILKFTPFASIYFTPVEIYLGQLTGRETLVKCLIQIVWIIIIYIIGNILWNKGQKKLVVQGGSILNEYLIWYNEERIKSTLNYMSLLTYRKSLGLIA